MEMGRNSSGSLLPVVGIEADGAVSPGEKWVRFSPRFRDCAFQDDRLALRLLLEYSQQTDEVFRMFFFHRQDCFQHPSGR